LIASSLLIISNSSNLFFYDSVICSICSFNFDSLSSFSLVILTINNFFSINSFSAPIILFKAIVNSFLVLIVSLLSDFGYITESVLYYNDVFWLFNCKLFICCFNKRFSSDNIWLLFLYNFWSFINSNYSFSLDFLFISMSFLFFIIKWKLSICSFNNIISLFVADF